MEGYIRKWKTTAVGEIATHIVCHEYQHEEEGKKDCHSIEGGSQCPRDWRDSRSDDDVRKFSLPVCRCL